MAIEITGTFGPTGTNQNPPAPAAFPTHEANFGLGGYMQVADDAARNGISDTRRAEGMAVYVNDTDKLYILKDGVTNNDWVEFSSGSGPGGSIDITDGTTTVSPASELALNADNFTVTAGTPNTKAEVTSAFNTTIDPTTSVAIDVNSLNNLTAADFDGLSMTAVFNKLLFPTLDPAYTQPTASLADSAPSTVEIGSTVNNTLTLELIKNDSGGYDSVSPSITSSLSGSLTVGGVTTTSVQNLPDQFGYPNANNDNFKYTCTATDNFTMPASGSVTYTSSIGYNAGNQLKDSTGADSGTAVAAGSKTPTNPGVNGIYPYFYGLSTSNWTDYATAVAEVVAEIQNPNGNATKVVAGSTGNISVAFNGTAGTDFMYFATPATSTTKTVWFENALNNGSIGGTSFSDPNRNLFSGPDTQSITTTLWSGVNYKIYVALKSSDTTTLQLKNS